MRTITTPVRPAGRASNRRSAHPGSRSVKQQSDAVQTAVRLYTERSGENGSPTRRKPQLSQRRTARMAQRPKRSSSTGRARFWHMIPHLLPSGRRRERRLDGERSAFEQRPSTRSVSCRECYSSSARRRRTPARPQPVGATSTRGSFLTKGNRASRYRSWQGRGPGTTMVPPRETVDLRRQPSGGLSAIHGRDPIHRAQSLPR